MILKIRAVWGCNYYWKLIDNVTEVNSRPISKEDRQDKRCNPNLYIQAINKLGKVDETMDIYKWIWCDVNGELFNICTNLNVYVLNDEGKTIDKLI